MKLIFTFVIAIAVFSATVQAFITSRTSMFRPRTLSMKAEAPPAVFSKEKMYNIAQENFKSWNQALKDKDSKRAASMYSSTDLSFLPTVSPNFIRDTHSAADYFVNFIQKQPDGEITSDAVQAFSSDAYLHTGMYTFMTGPSDNRQPVKARFSYMWKYVAGSWKIIHHHSSVVPGQIAASKPSTLNEDMHPIAQENFKKWNDALQTKDYAKVAALYSATDLSFLPTVSPEFVRDAKTTEEYFKNFLQKFPHGTITKDNVQAYSDDAYLHTGMYTFMVGPADARQAVNARFSYMWRKVDGAWKIVHHHSSVVPGAGAATSAEVASEEMYPVAQENFKMWNDALQTRDYEKVADLYSASELSFLPTVSPEFVRDAGATREYFKAFLQKLPHGTITSDNVQPYGPNAYLHSGMYTFMVGPEDARQAVNARFSYMWRKIDGVWKIVHHHSSAVPSAAPAATAEAMYPVAQANFKAWNDALQTQDYEQVADLYSAENLSFLPTVSGEFVRDAESTKEYFKAFLQKFPHGTITADDVQPYGADAYLHTGMYTFMVGPADARQAVKARFSYMWRKIDGKWKIVHHHSSATPGAAKEITVEEMYPIAQANFKTWNDALVAKNYQKVAGLYASKDISFLPTVSPKFIRDGEEAQKYFIDFVQKLPDGIITADDVKPFGPDAYLHTGMYTFNVGPADNRQPVNARFSYMWRKIDGEWKIVHHHSSAVPKAPGSQEAESSAEIMYPVAQANFKAWNDALQTKDYKKVAGLYANTDISFLPTVSPKFIRDSKEAEKYFIDFLQKLPSGTITADDVQPYGPDAYLHTGMYTFMVGPEENRQAVNARFSYMWRKVDGAWKIVHHHSSAVPAGAAAPAQDNVDMYAVAQDNFKSWNDALISKDYLKVAGHYCTEELSFLPTVSPKFIQDAPSTQQYFVDFVQKLPSGTITADNVQQYGPNAYLHTGMYTFMTGPQTNRQPVKARFSYMWKKKADGWKIVHHHSSALPQGSAPQPTPEAEEAAGFTITTAENSEKESRKERFDTLINNIKKLKQ